MEEESRWACPACGARRLALEELPRVGAMGAQPYTDMIGMGDPVDRKMPEIVCLECGRRWPDAEAFWAEVGTPNPGRAQVTDQGVREVAILADDLIWATRLTDTIRDLGVQPRPVRRLEDLGRLLGLRIPFVIVDLTARAYDGVEGVRLARAGGARVLAVGQHDDLDLRRRALAAGAERVYAYRRLFESGPATLGAWLDSAAVLPRSEAKA